MPVLLLQEVERSAPSYRVLHKDVNHRVLRKYLNPNCCNYLYFNRSKFTYLCKKQ